MHTLSDYGMQWISVLRFPANRNRAVIKKSSGEIAPVTTNLMIFDELNLGRLPRLQSRLLAAPL